MLYSKRALYKILLVINKLFAEKTFFRDIYSHKICANRRY